MKTTPDTRINTWLAVRGYQPVEFDATIHDCYIALLHFNRLETVLGDVSGRRTAILEAIVEAEDSPGITMRTLQGWADTVYEEVQR